MSSSTFAKSTLILSVAMLLSKILGSVFRIPLQNIAGDEVLGIFSLVYPVYMVALYLSVAGIPLAISKLISEATTRGETYKVHKIYVTASLLAITFGLLCFSILFGFSNQIAALLGGPSTRLALILVALTLLVAPYMAVYRGFFQGYSNMNPTAISQVIEQFIRAVLILLIAFVLVKLDYSNEVVAGGVMLGSFVGAFASLLYLLYKYKKSPVKAQKETAYTSTDFTKYSKTILVISIPIAIGSVTMALFNIVDSFTITHALRASGVIENQINYMYGIYGRGLSLVQITSVFASAIILPLVPLITKKLVENDRFATKSIIEQTHKITHLISWPAAIGLFALTIPLNLALFTNTEGSWMMAVLNLSSVFTSLTLLSTGILQGMNAARLAAYVILGGVVLKIATNIFFISQFGLDGAAYSTLFVYFIILSVNTYLIYRSIQFKVISMNIMKIIGAAIVMGAVVGLPTLYFNVAQWSRLFALCYVFIAIIVGAAIYFILLWMSKGIDEDDLNKIPFIGGKLSRLLYSNQKNSKKNQSIQASMSPPSAEGVIPNSTNERKTFMPNIKWLWGVIVALLVVASMPLIDRHQAEKKSNQYEITIPFEEVVAVHEATDVPVEQLLKQLKDNGLVNVSLTPLTLTSLVRSNNILIYEESELEKQLRFTEFRNDVDVSDLGYYISIPSVKRYQDLIEQVLAPEKVLVANQEFYFLRTADTDYTLTSPMGYDTVAIEAIKASGLNYTLRVSNGETPEINEMITNLILQLKSDQSAGILSAGGELIGYGQPNGLKHIKKIKEAGYYFYQIESMQIKGEQHVGPVFNYDIVRLRSVDVNRNPSFTNKDMAEISVRAVKERNIRTIFAHIKTTGNMEDNFNNSLLLLQKIQNDMPDRFTLGKASLMDKVTIPAWSVAAILLAGILMTFIMSEILVVRVIRVLAVIGMIGLAGAYFALDRVMFVQGFALLIAVMAPSYAVIKYAKGTTKLSAILLQYLKATCVTAIGIWIVIGLLNGNIYYMGYQQFRGVILVYLIPIAVVTIYAIMQIFTINIRDEKGSVAKVKQLFNSPILYWQAAVLVVLAAVVFFYIGRTGNSGFAPAFEITVRQWLEDTLYVRPRTKEFLIGFPMFVLALYVLKSNRIIGSLLLIPGVIGFLSIMNTFTHLHMPLEASLLRTAYSLVLGFLIGLVFIIIYKILRHYGQQLMKRWS